MRMRAAALASVLSATVLLAGCGSDTVTPPAVPATLSSASPPANLPRDAVPAPGDFVLTHAMTVTVDGEEQFVLTYRKPGADSDAVRGYLGELKNDGFKLKDGYPDSSNVDGGMWVLTNPKWRVGLAATVTEGETVMVVKVDPD